MKWNAGIEGIEPSPDRPASTLRPPLCMPLLLGVFPFHVHLVPLRILIRPEVATDDAEARVKEPVRLRFRFQPPRVRGVVGRVTEDGSPVPSLRHVERRRPYGYRHCSS